VIGGAIIGGGGGEHLGPTAGPLGTAAVLDRRRVHQLHDVDAPALEEMYEALLADAVGAIRPRLARQPAFGNPMKDLPVRCGQKVGDLMNGEEPVLHVTESLHPLKGMPTRRGFVQTAQPTNQPL
jgi:hypothetical protein